jgi:hypothetical protein
MLFVGANDHAATSTRPPHPASHVRDDRDTPLQMEAGHAHTIINSEKKKQKYLA